MMVNEDDMYFFIIQDVELYEVHFPYLRNR